MTKGPKQRVTFTVQDQGVEVPLANRLRWLLKILLRQLRLKCVNIDWTDPTEADK